MIGAVQYAAANATIQAGIGRLLQEDIWERLLAASGLAEILSILSETSYRETMLEEPGRVKEVERLLRSYLADRFRLPLPFLGGRVYHLLDWLWRPFEIDNLIIVLRGLHNNVSGSRIRSSLVSLGRGSELPWREMTNSQSISDLIDNVDRSFHGSLYARALENAYNEYQRQQAVFVLEVALYLAYYRRLHRMLERLQGRDRKDAERFVGTAIDSRNLLAAFRYGPETILSYTLPRQTRVNSAVMQRAATDAPVAELVRSVWGRELSGLSRIEGRSPREAVVELELIFQRHLYSMVRDSIAGYWYPFHLGMILSYEVLLQSEVDDLITIIEGTMNGWSAEHIRSRGIRWAQ